MPIKRKVAEGHLEKVQNAPPTIRLSQDTRHAPAAKQETSKEHKANHMPIQKKKDETTLTKCCYQLCLMTKPP